MEARYYVLLVLGVIFLSLSLFFKKISDEPKDMMPAVGTIVKIGTSKTDTVGGGEGPVYYTYYVEFESGQGVEVGESIGYDGKVMPFGIGSIVNIKYYRTKSGKARVVINEPGFSELSKASLWPVVGALLLGVMCFIGFAILAVRNL